MTYKKKLIIAISLQFRYATHISFSILIQTTRNVYLLSIKVDHPSLARTVFLRDIFVDSKK